MNVKLIDNAQQHVRTPLQIVGKDDVTIPFERSVDATDELDRHFFVCVPMRIAHVGSLVDQYVIENRAVAFSGVVQLLYELGQVLNVVPIDLGV